MPEPNTFTRLVLTTASSPEEAALLGRTLVEEGLAACANVTSSSNPLSPSQSASVQSIINIAASAINYAAPFVSILAVFVPGARPRPRSMRPG